MHLIQVLLIAAECAAGWGAKAKSMRSRVTGRQKKNPAGAGFVCGLIVSLEIGRRVKREEVLVFATLKSSLRKHSRSRDNQRNRAFHLH